jgi:hypothetical protein
MDPEILRDQLSKLHDELKKTRVIDPKASEMLGEVLKDIRRLLELPDAADPSLTDRLERIAVQFEADHPALAANSRRLIDLLGKVGL